MGVGKSIKFDKLAVLPGPKYTFRNVSGNYFLNIYNKAPSFL